MGRRRRANQATGTLWEQFVRRHAGQRFLECEVLYSLTAPIIDAVITAVPGFFTLDELCFERDLARIASFGFFQGSPLGFSETSEGTSDGMTRGEQAERQARSDQAIHEMLREEYRRSGTTDVAINATIQADAERREVINARKRSFVGWLVANHDFRREVNELRADWEPAIRELRRFPVLPRWPAHDLGLEGAQPQGLREAFLPFYRRWGLEQLLTWDWPIPMEPDLVGGMLGDLDSFTETGLMLFVPWYMLRDGKLRLNELAQDKLVCNVPQHLRKWVQRTGRADELGDLRYVRLAWIYRFLMLALRPRYPQACCRKTQKLDHALSCVLKLKEESVRKIRLELQQALTTAE